MTALSCSDILDKIDLRYIPRDTEGGHELSRVVVDAATIVLMSDLSDQKKLYQLRQLFRHLYPSLVQRIMKLSDRQCRQLETVLEGWKPFPKHLRYTLLNSFQTIADESMFHHGDYYVWLLVWLCDRIPTRPSNIRVCKGLDDYLCGYMIHRKTTPENDLIHDVTGTRCLYTRLLRFMAKDPNIAIEHWAEEAFNTYAYATMVVYLVLAARSHYDPQVQAFMVAQLYKHRQDIRENCHVDVYDAPASKQTHRRDQGQQPIAPQR
jgi:hypothetical protein